MVDFASLAETHADVPDDQLKAAGKAIGGAMGDQHNDFLKMIVGMIQRGEIDYHVPQTFLNKNIYDALDEMSRGKVDLVMMNLADLLRHITEFYLSKKTPDESPQLQTMIEQLWQMKEKAENQYGDVFKF